MADAAAESKPACKAAPAALGDDDTDAGADAGDTELGLPVFRGTGIKCVFHLFLTAMSVRQGGPPSSFVISIRLFPSRPCPSRIVASSSSVHGTGPGAKGRVGSGIV